MEAGRKEDPQQIEQQKPQQKNETKTQEEQKEDHTLFNRIYEFLKSKSIQFEVLEHQPTRTSEESANIRNTPLEWGAKTMLVKGKQYTYLLIYRANRKVSWSKLRKLEQIGKKGAMCKEQDVVKLGVRPGGVPPFSQLLGVKGLVDKKFREQKMVAFNAGLMGKSIIMKTEDYPENQFQADFTD